MGLDIGGQQQAKSVCRIALRSADSGYSETMEPKSKADYRMLHLFYNDGDIDIFKYRPVWEPGI
jgi:hypothetical protein